MSLAGVSPLPVAPHKWDSLVCQQAQLCCSHTSVSEPGECSRLWLSRGGIEAWSASPPRHAVCQEPWAAAMSEAACAWTAWPLQVEEHPPPREQQLSWYSSNSTWAPSSPCHGLFSADPEWVPKLLGGSNNNHSHFQRKYNFSAVHVTRVYYRQNKGHPQEMQPF